MKQLIPQFPLPYGFSSADEYLRDLVSRGARVHYGHDIDSPMQTVAERIDRELGVIAKLGCADYFLVLWDALRHARQEGIAISPVDIMQHFSTERYINRDGEELPMICEKTQEIEDKGFLIFHFLHLPELSVIRNTKMFVEQRKNISIKDIPLNDADTFKLLCDGQTVSTFQFDGEGISKCLRELQPTSFSDLVALNSIYRPGPMEWLPDVIARKHGEQPAAASIPAVEKCLKETYGFTAYQEQIMQLSQALANFTPYENDRLRKALWKKKDVARFKKLFIERATAKGYERETIELLWSDMERRGSYLFNKSHSVCYTLIAYQTAYLKAHFPTEYMAARLLYDLNNQEALSDYLFNNNYTDYLGNDLDKDLQECHRMGIHVTGLDRTCAVNRVTISQDGTVCCGQTARFLQTGIKQIDDNIGGLPLGSVTLIAGRPMKGKTLLSLILAKSLAADNRIPVAYFSLEYSAEQIVYKLFSMLWRRLKRRTCAVKKEWKWINKQTECLIKEPPFYMDDMTHRPCRSPISRQRPCGLYVRKA